jgi:hypothetical protein
MWVRSGGGAVDKSGQWTDCGYLLSTGLCITLSTGGVDIFCPQGYQQGVDSYKSLR